ncbi:MAG: MBL fold metallo-hydrolase [Alphaproteobacteria bacterium]
MNGRLKIRLLGCGSSGGVPLSNGEWGACDPANPRNQRTRPSVLVEAGDGRTLVIDTSPDFRVQAAAAGLRRVDAVLYTHGHADHTHGIDDLRAFNFTSRAPIPAYGTAETLESLSSRFSYVFDIDKDNGTGRLGPALIGQTIAYGQRFSAAGLDILPFRQSHGPAGETTGYRIGRFAYSTDVVELEETAFAALDGLDLWIVDCLRQEPHPTHSHLARSLEWIARVGPRQAWLTHMSHATDYAVIAALCPPGVVPGHDGLEMMVE